MPNRTSYSLALKTVAAFLLLSLSPSLQLVQAANLFEQEAERAFTGRFCGKDNKAGKEVSLRLWPEAGRFKGTLVLTDTTYPVQGEQRDGHLQGTYGEGTRGGTFKATSDGDMLTYTAGGFSATLKRRLLPKLAGVYSSSQVTISFYNDDGGTNGSIQFKGHEMPFTAAELAGDLEGIARNGQELTRFVLANETEGLTFKVGNGFGSVVRVDAEATRKRESAAFAPLREDYERVLAKGDTNVLERFEQERLAPEFERLKGSWARALATADLDLLQKYGGDTWEVLPQWQKAAEAQDDPSFAAAFYLTAVPQLTQVIEMSRARKKAAEEAEAVEEDKRIAAFSALIEKSPVKAVFTNSLGMPFVPVPGTKVLFCMIETRRQDYAPFAEANRGLDLSWRNPGSAPGEDHPVVIVSWDDATAFCQWLSRKEGRSYRLPTDAEWSKAVGLNESIGGTPADKSRASPAGFPWGAEWPPPDGAGNYNDHHEAIPDFSDGFKRTAPVGSFAANAIGIYDLGGNVWEWCEDWYDGEQKTRVLRGASWASGYRGTLRSCCRIEYTSDIRDGSIGFRLVLVPDSSR